MIKVVVNGALGRMGSEVVKAVSAAQDMELVGLVDAIGAGSQVQGITVGTDLALVLSQTKPDVVVDFTRPDVVMANVRTVLQSGVNAVVGTTGFTEADLAQVEALAKENKVAALIAPNFALGAVLMLRAACEIAKYFPQVEIIELHHDQKLDAPSGTAVLTAQKLAAVRGGFVQQGRVDETEKLPHVRGNNYQGMHIHSVRLPGFVASEEIIFGSTGERLTIRNDSINRECYMPGVLLGCRKVIGKVGLLYGLDAIL